MKAVTNLVVATVASATLGVVNIGLAVPTVSGVSLEQIEGTRAVKINYTLDESAISPNWPQSDVVHENSFMGRMRTRTGLATFDLPTEAQWEWACRAGTTGALNDGSANQSNTTTCAYLDQLGCYAQNGGRPSGKDPATGCTTDNATAAVGSYLPNGWGLYDMHGNVLEWCLDWFDDTKEGGTDPVGATSGANRARRGGCWRHSATIARSAYRAIDLSSSTTSETGFRLVRVLP